MLEFLQRIGRSIMVPIAVLPVAALLLRLGAPDMLNIPFIMAAGSAIFDNLALLFAIGIAIGMSDDHRGEAVLAAVVGFLVLVAAAQTLLTSSSFLGAGYAADDDLVTKLSNNVLIGIITGLIAVWTYNRFHKTRLPSVLSFFSGRRLVPILTAFFVLVPALLLRFVWPPFWNGLAAFNTILLGWGALGAGVYGMLNRALIPFGLHHVLNSYFWFSVGEFVTASGETITGDIPRFLNGDPTAGPYQVGFYPIMMAGLVGAALAMIVHAKKEERGKIAGLLGGAALISFVTGITEPLEFSFLFAAPILFGIHALLTGLSMLVTNLMGLRHGFGFSAGLIDYLLNFGLAEGPLMLAAVGGVFFLIYFVVFYFAIRLLDLKTPGREAAGEVTKSDLEEVMLGVSRADDDMTAAAKGYVRALGGANNIVSVENCATRLRLSVKNSAQVNANQLKNLGAKGVVKPSSTAVQIIVGVQAEFLADAVREILNGSVEAIPAASALPEAQPAPVVQSHPAALPAARIDDPAMVASVDLIIRALGEPENIQEVTVVATTRVRVVVKNPAEVSEDAILAAGAHGVMALGSTYHILLGMKADAYGSELQAYLLESEVA